MGAVLDGRDRDCLAGLGMVATVTLVQALQLSLWANLLLLVAALAILAAEAMVVWTWWIAPLIAQWRVWRTKW